MHEINRKVYQLPNFFKAQIVSNASCDRKRNRTIVSNANYDAKRNYTTMSFLNVSVLAGFQGNKHIRVQLSLNNEYQSY